MSKKIAVAVSGCTGMVGQQFLRMLWRHPRFAVRALIASPRSEGCRYTEVSDWRVSASMPPELARMRIEPLHPSVLRERGIGVMFSALPAGVAAGAESRMREAGVAVFSNAAAHRSSEDIPILLPEVNPEHLHLARAQKRRFGGFIITNSNCCVSGLALSLKPLLEFGIQRVDVVTFQAVSGGGRRGVASMDILDNVIPFIPAEEEKIENELKKIFGRLVRDTVEPWPGRVFASCCRVPVREGHLECVTVSTRNPVEESEIIDAWSSFSAPSRSERLPSAPRRPIVLFREPNRPQPGLDAHLGGPARTRGMAVGVGRIRATGERIRYFMLVNNTIRGAAGTSILNAELAAANGLI